MISFSLEIDEEEDEEDEDEEDEEEEDEEEDEDDKDADSLDESLDGDTELPVFTVPGVTSQEPGLEQDNMGPMEGATYQVPDAIEWRQQNQGLGRSCLAPFPSSSLLQDDICLLLVFVMEQNGFSAYRCSLREELLIISMISLCLFS